MKSNPGPLGRALAATCAAAGLLFAHSAAWAQETFEETTVWLPADFSEHGHAIDVMFNFILYTTTIVGVLVFAALLLFLYQYRFRPGRHAKYIHGNTKLELVWTLIPTLILALTAALSQETWSQIKYHENRPQPDENPVRLQVIGKQFKWYFHYAGADGKFGPTLDAKLVDRDASEPEKIIGLDRSHPDGKDDIVAVQMFVPVNRPILVDLHSVDVLHSFFLPSFRMKQDAVPRLEGLIWFTANRTSRQVVGEQDDARDSSKGEDPHPIWQYERTPKPFDIVCAELCGAGHWTMRGDMFVVTEEEYERFLKHEASFLDSGDDFGF